MTHRAADDVRRRTRLADQVADEVRQHFGDVVLAPMIPRNVRVSEAPGFGQTVMTYDPGSRGAIGYLQAAHEIAARGVAAVGASTEANVPGTERTAVSGNQNRLGGLGRGLGGVDPVRRRRRPGAH